MIIPQGRCAETILIKSYVKIHPRAVLYRFMKSQHFSDILETPEPEVEGRGRGREVEGKHYL